MVKKIAWPTVIGLILACILLIVFPSLRSNEKILLPNHLFRYDPLSFREAVKKAAPAVVNIYSQAKYSGKAPYQTDITPLGSGVIMSKKGYILTNHHVIDGAKQIIVALQTGKIYEAIIIGSDKLIDLAILKIEANDLPVIPINLKRVPHIGDVVLAIGNPYNIGQTITQGIISATGRDGLSPYRRQNFIQTDASINYGNSGGALVNSLGELVGINTLSITKNDHFEVSEGLGLGFAIPTSLATKIMNKLIEDGQIIRGYIGVDGLEFAPIQDNKGNRRVLGILVTNTDGPAQIAGIKPNDILISVDNKPVTSIIETMDQIAETKPETTIPVTVLRLGKKINLQLTIGKHPIHP